MGQELLDIKGYERKPRVYYKAQSSTGYVFIRGSWQDVYSHAVVVSKSPNFRPHQVETYGWCSRRKELSERTLKRFQKTNAPDSGYEYELIELVQITAKEVRAIKKASKKEWQALRDEMLSKGKNQQQETEI